MNTVILTIVAVVTLVLIWITRACMVYKLTLDVCKNIEGSGEKLWKLTKLIIFDVIFCFLTVLTIGKGGSNFSIQLIIWLNALTTIFGTQLLKIIIWNTKRSIEKQ